MTDWLKEQGDLAREFKAEGQKMTLRTIIKGEYTPGTEPTNTESDSFVWGFNKAISNRRIGETLQAGTTITGSERELTLEASGVTPKLADIIFIGGVRFRVLNVQTTDPAGVALSHRVVVAV